MLTQHIWENLPNAIRPFSMILRVGLSTRLCRFQVPCVDELVALPKVLIGYVVHSHFFISVRIHSNDSNPCQEFVCCYSATHGYASLHSNARMLSGPCVYGKQTTADYHKFVLLYLCELAYYITDCIMISFLPTHRRETNCSRVPVTDLEEWRKNRGDQDNGRSQTLMETLESRQGFQSVILKQSSKKNWRCQVNVF